MKTKLTKPDMQLPIVSMKFEHETIHRRHHHGQITGTIFFGASIEIEIKPPLSFEKLDYIIVGGQRYQKINP